MSICLTKLPLRNFLRSACLALLLWQPLVYAEDDAQALTRLRAEMESVAGKPNCANVVHCRVVTMGYDACGNPTAQLTYNHLRDVDNELRAKAAEYTFIEEEQHRGKTRPADCKASAKPKLSCVNNRCVVSDTSY